MKLFQQLLIAPAAIGLLAPIAATANEVNLDTVASEDLAAGTKELLCDGSWCVEATKRRLEASD